MADGYVEFEFDLTDALLEKLINIFEKLQPVPLIADTLDSIPDEQGVYQLFLKDGDKNDLVYIGKTDAEAGLRKRLSRHARKVQYRLGLDPEDVLFKAVRIFVFTVVDLETQLIRHYGGTTVVSWNGSGFGSNDPGKERDTTNYKEDHFDTIYPIDIDRELDFSIPIDASAAEILYNLKANLPFLLRFQNAGQNWRIPHQDLKAAVVKLDTSKSLTARSVVEQVIEGLPKGWHATKLPSHIIMYKNDTRKFPSGQLISKSADR